MLVAHTAYNLLLKACFEWPLGMPTLWMLIQHCIEVAVLQHTHNVSHDNIAEAHVCGSQSSRLRVKLSMNPIQLHNGMS